jgi:hypothetical protein
MNLQRAWDPDPPCNAQDQPPVVELCWEPGDLTPPITFHVFLSNCFEDVNTGSLHAWQTAQTDTCYTTPPLCLGDTYYWRIDSVDDCNYAPGQVWSFTVVDKLCVEEFETYNNVTNPIWETWIDGCGDEHGMGGNRTGSCVYTGTPGSPCSSGPQCMMYYYDCSGQDMAGDERDCNYAEATRTFDEAQDWLENCAEAVKICFKGDPGNAHGPLEAMYVMVTDTADQNALVYYGTKAPELLSDMTNPDWQPWAVALDEFVAANPAINLASLASVSLGFGDPSNCHREKGGWGVMWFDQICLWPCHCIPKYTPDIIDLNADCVTDWLDLKIICDNWLEDQRCDTPPY